MLCTLNLFAMLKLMWIKKGVVATVDCNCLPWHYRVNVCTLLFIMNAVFRVVRLVTILCRAALLLVLVNKVVLVFWPPRLNCIIELVGRNDGKLPPFLAVFIHFATHRLSAFSPSLVGSRVLDNEFLMRHLRSLKAAKFTKLLVRELTKTYARTLLH